MKFFIRVMQFSLCLLFWPSSVQIIPSVPSSKSTVLSRNYIYLYLVNYFSEKGVKTKVTDLDKVIFYTKCNLSVRSIILFRSCVWEKIKLGFRTRKVRLTSERKGSKLN
jgi:hypothetical protein